MKYYSTNGNAPIADLQKAVVKGLAEDRGLYMPEEIYTLPKAFINDMPSMKFQDIAYNVAQNFFGDDVDGDALQDIVYDTLSFDCPVVKVTENIYALELFHGPTLAFKDVGARFMARLLGYFLRRSGSLGQGSSADLGGSVCGCATATNSAPVLVSESGISNPDTVKALRQAGFRGFLIGENFMKTSDPGLALNAFIQSIAK